MQLDLQKTNSYQHRLEIYSLDFLF